MEIKQRKRRKKKKRRNRREIAEIKQEAKRKADRRLDRLFKAYNEAKRRAEGKKNTAPREDLVRSMAEEIGLEMHIQGYTYEEIAERLDIAPVTAWRRVQKYVKKITKRNTEKAEYIRTVELRRLERLYKKAQENIDSADPYVRNNAIQTCLAIAAQKRKYIAGLEVPRVDKLEIGVEKEMYDMIREGEKQLLNLFNRICQVPEGEVIDIKALPEPEREE